MKWHVESPTIHIDDAGGCEFRKDIRRTDDGEGQSGYGVEETCPPQGMQDQSAWCGHTSKDALNMWSQGMLVDKIEECRRLIRIETDMSEETFQRQCSERLGYAREVFQVSLFGFADAQVRSLMPIHFGWTGMVQEVQYMVEEFIG